jgi:hypothetical protein
MENARSWVPGRPNGDKGDLPVENVIKRLMEKGNPTRRRQDYNIAAGPRCDGNLSATAPLAG